MDTMLNDQYEDDYAQYEADMGKIEEDCLRIIAKATHEPIAEDEAALLRWASGVTTH